MKVGIAYFTVVLIWATTPLAIFWSGHIDWFFGIAARMLIAAIVILPIIIWFVDTPFSFKWQEVRIYLSASLGIFAGMTSIYYAAQTMPSGWISVLFGLTPIITAIIAHFFFAGFRFTKIKLFAILISFIGLVIIFLPKLSSHNIGFENLAIGIFFAILAVIFHALGTLLVKKYNHGIPNTHIVAATLWISSIAFLIINPSFILQWPEMDTKALTSIIYLGVIGSVLGYILFYYVLVRIDAVRIGLITLSVSLITPIIAVFLGYYLNNEPLTPTITFGIFLVLTGLFVFEFIGNKTKTASLPLEPT